MANYILKELPGEMTEGKTIVYPKMQTYSRHDYEQVIHNIRVYANGIGEEIIRSRGYMTLTDYALATGQSRTTASNDLKGMVADPDSGITTRGQRPHKIWIEKLLFPQESCE